MIDSRLDRMEDKVDKIQEQVSELNVDLKVHMALIEEHVTGDKKIINEIQPMIRDYYFQKEQKARQIATLKKTSLVTAILASIAAIFHKFI